MNTEKLAEVNLRKVKAYDLLRMINQAANAAKQWQDQLRVIEKEINELEAAGGDS